MAVKKMGDVESSPTVDLAGYSLTLASYATLLFRNAHAHPNTITVRILIAKSDAHRHDCGRRVFRKAHGRCNKELGARPQSELHSLPAQSRSCSAITKHMD